MEEGSVLLHSILLKTGSSRLFSAKMKIPVPALRIFRYVCGRKSMGKVITRKPILPGAAELEDNSRSKSAKLRIFERRVEQQEDLVNVKES